MIVENNNDTNYSIVEDFLQMSNENVLAFSKLEVISLITRYFLVARIIHSISEKLNAIGLADDMTVKARVDYVLKNVYTLSPISEREFDFLKDVMSRETDKYRKREEDSNIQQTQGIG